jgi:ribosomal protein S18 acetylase RimI-like enzyme
VVIRTLDPAESADEELWAAVVEVQVQGREDGHAEEGYRAFSRARLDDLRAHFRTGRGAWYVARDPSTQEVVASCGVVVTGGRARFQAVDTAPGFRRRGIASRLLVEAAHRSAAQHAAERFVIVADLGYHALGLYESLGFERAEHVVGVCLWPRSEE